MNRGECVVMKCHRRRHLVIRMFQRQRAWRFTGMAVRGKALSHPGASRVTTESSSALAGSSFSAETRRREKERRQCYQYDPLCLSHVPLAACLGASAGTDTEYQSASAGVGFSMPPSSRTRLTTHFSFWDILFCHLV